MTQEQIIIRATLESVYKRQYELTKANGQILDWAMKIVFGKKKVPMPEVKIFDYMPYILEPKDVQDFAIPFSEPAETQPIPFNPPKQFLDIPVQTKIIKMIPRKPLGEPSKSLIEPKEKKKQ